uniref:Uncharacterized protein n=1 Tax=Cacopsylla melanoneura TaxID=428564 RepID=A0A8D8XBE5_9HEMI
MSCAIQPDCDVCTAAGGVCAVLNGPGHPKCLDKKTQCYTKIWLCDAKNPDVCSWQPFTYEKVNCGTCHGTCGKKAQTCVSNGKTRHFICHDIRTNCHWLENGKPDPCTAG